MPNSPVTWVVVADGERALVLCNDGHDRKPSLRVVEEREIDNPPTREQGAARPGRMNDGAGGPRRSAVEETDWKRLGKARFAADLAGMLDRAAQENRFARLVIMAPPTSLGDLRANYSEVLSSRLVAEINGDYTKHPVADIEAKLADALGG